MRTIRLLAPVACGALLAIVMATAAGAQGGPPPQLSADPYWRAVVCAATLAKASQATSGQDETVSSAMADGMGRWLLRAADLGAAAGKTGAQVQSAVEFNMTMLDAFIGDPAEREKILDNTQTCAAEASGLPN